MMSETISMSSTWFYRKNEAFDHFSDELKAHKEECILYTSMYW
jgi:chemotaxis methyl-accepting protein methylase